MPEDGLAAFGDGRDDLMMALARQIVSGKEDADADTVEAVVGQAGDTEAASEDYLMDDGCKLFEVEPKAVVVKGIGHHDEAPEPQQSLFSWAEFMAEEPVKLNGRSRKAQPPSLSLFEWAVEQEREAEPVGAGR